MDKRKIIYYTDELNDEFSVAQIKTKLIDGNYCYGKNTFGDKFLRFFWYRIIATPFAYLFLKFKYHHKIVNRKILKAAKGKPFFMFANHTNDIADAFIPTILAYPVNVFVIVHANNVSMPVLGRINPYLGALPLPATKEATKNFLEIIKRRVEQKNCIMIYPEAHIWPFYTKIRPFTDMSFRYPVQYDTPVFCFTNTYQKRKWGKLPRIVTYVDGPFYPDKTLDAKSCRKDLRDKVYEAMVRRTEFNNIELIKYVKKESEGDSDD